MSVSGQEAPDISSANYRPWLQGEGKEWKLDSLLAASIASLGTLGPLSSRRNRILSLQEGRPDHRHKMEGSNMEVFFTVKRIELGIHISEVFCNTFEISAISVHRSEVFTF